MAIQRWNPVRDLQVELQEHAEPHCSTTRWLARSAAASPSDDQLRMAAWKSPDGPVRRAR